MKINKNEHLGYGGLLEIIEPIELGNNVWEVIVNLVPQR